MKAILEFSLPEDREDHRIAVNAGVYHGECHAIAQWTRGKRKYGTLSKTDEILLEELTAVLYDHLDGVEL